MQLNRIALRRCFDDSPEAGFNYVTSRGDPDSLPGRPYVFGRISRGGRVVKDVEIHEVKPIMRAGTEVLHVMYSYYNVKSGRRVKDFKNFYKDDQEDWTFSLLKVSVSILKRMSVLKDYRESVWEIEQFKNGPKEERLIRFNKLFMKKMNARKRVEEMMNIRDTLLDHPKVRLHTLF